MEIRMRHISNAASALALLIVVAALAASAAGKLMLPMDDVLRAALFIKGVFLQVDVSCWIGAFRQ